MFNFGGGAGPGNSGVKVSRSVKSWNQQDMNSLIEAYKEKENLYPKNYKFQRLNL